MQVHREIHKLPKFRNAVITIGTFDGVHKGHQQILQALRKVAAEVNGESVLITFHPHPRKIVQPDSSLELINSLDERIDLLAKHQIDHLVVVPFTPEFAAQDPDDYIKNFLVELFAPSVIIIGYDHHFGKDRKGGFQLLSEDSKKYNYRLIEIPRHVLNEIGVSSTKIRNAIKASDIQTANDLLGYHFFFHGRIVHGDKLGRMLGYPTANIQYTDADKIHTGEGVYAAVAEVKGELKKGMLSIGTRPTLEDKVQRVEINIFDFNDDIYNEEIVIHVVKFLRGQVKYPTLEALQEQMARDRVDSLHALTNHEAF